MSYHIYNFGLEAIHTRSSASIALMKLPIAYKRENCDIITFFRLFLNEMVTLIETNQTMKNKQIPCCMCILSFRLKYKLLFLQPLYQHADEEQDRENESVEIIPDPQNSFSKHGWQPAKSPHNFLVPQNFLDQGNPT